MDPLRPEDLAERIHDLLEQLQADGGIHAFSVSAVDDQQTSWSVRYRNGEGSMIRVWLDAESFVRRARLSSRS